MTPENIFQFPETSLGKIATKRIILVYPMIICALIAAFIIVNHLENNEFIENNDLLLIFAGMATLFLIGGFFSGKKAIVKVLQDTKFVLKENSVEKVIPNGENTLIPFREIKDFQETRNGVLIKTANKRLQIPHELEGFDALSKGIRSHIHSHIISYQTKFKIHQSVLNNIAAVGTLLVLVGFFIADTKEQKLGIGIPLFLFLCVALLKIIADKKNKQLEFSTIIKAVFFTIALFVYLAYTFFSYNDS